MDDMESPITEWFTNKSILITGATGFMGKILMEKLLRSLPHIKVIYALVRFKHDVNPEERLQKIFNYPVFDRLKQSSPNQLTKIIPINGDMTKDNLGLSEEDLNKLKKNVTVIFHLAATVRFDQPLKTALNLNLGGTKRLLKLVETFDKIDAFIHASTSYCHLEVEELEDKMYPSPHPPEQVLELCEWLSDDALESMAPILMGRHPNTYSYTKCLTETFVDGYSAKFPLCIARPTIVAACLKDPLPGWIETMNGPTGLIVGAGKGVLRSMLCNLKIKADVIPVDICINALLIGTWWVGTKRPTSTFVLNITQSQENAFYWGEALQLVTKYVYMYPSSVMLWYPDGSPKSNAFAHKVCVIFFHFLPAYLIDGLLYVIGKKPFLVNVQNRIQTGLKVLDYYANREWHFSNKQLKALDRMLTARDRLDFYTHMKDIDWDNYMHTYVLAIRKFILKEDPATIPSARRTFKRLYYVDRITSLIVTSLLIYLLYTYVFKPLII